MFAIGIDTGGTFTDAFVVRDGAIGEFPSVKVETTPHDLTVCFREAVERCAEAAGLPLVEFLRETNVIRFSSTIGTNAVLTLSGAKLGLIVTAGHERDLYGAANDAIFSFVSPELVVGIDEAVAADGTVVTSPNGEQVRLVVRDLLERGARTIVTSLGNASVSADNERAVRQIVDDAYPRHYLGAVPVLLSTQVSAVGDDAERTAAAVVNAYIHKKLATSLYKAEDDLRRSGFRRPLLIVTADGGVTRVAKTRALSTYHSGPAGGIHGSALLCRSYGLPLAITADVGGTTTDLSVIVDGRPIERASLDVRGVPVAQPTVEIDSVAIGGGSICRVEDGAVAVGPQSTGASPGPACFALGGQSATPTDAWLVLGYLDPEYYFGGRKRLDVQLARDALQREIVEPLGLASVEDAALAVKAAAEQAVAASIEVFLARLDAEGIASASAADASLLAFGGGGGLLLPAAAARLGIRQTIISHFSPVFSAFGISTFDVRHRYDARLRVNGTDGHAGAAVAALVEDARRDMRGEGFDADELVFSLAVYDEAGTALVGGLDLAGAERWFADSRPSSGLLRIALVAGASVAKAALEPKTVRAGVGGAARRGERTIVLPDGQQRVAVFARDLLQPGASIVGPAIVEADDVTCLVPPGDTCRIDEFGSAVISAGAA